MANADTSISKYLLVPINVEALVIDGKTSGDRLTEAAPSSSGGRLRAPRLRWSSACADYGKLADTFDPPGPQAFFQKPDAANAGKSNASNIYAATIRPDKNDRGVYVSWDVPKALRRSRTVNEFDFPALPDQWLVIRFVRDGKSSPVSSAAWFIDSGAVVDDEKSASVLVFDDASKSYRAKHIGKVTPLTGSAVTPPAERVAFTVLGPEKTSSPTFSVSLAENRNVLSWHDTLDGVAQTSATGNGLLLEGRISLSYFVIGWHREEQNEPLRSAVESLRTRGLPWFKDGAQLPDATPQDIFAALEWDVEGTSLDAQSVGSARCLYFGMVAQIYFWDTERYKGPLLGYPGAPPRHHATAEPAKSLEIGLGQSVADAVVALLYDRSAALSERFSDDLRMWEAFEALMHGQRKALLNRNGDRSKRPLHQAIHQGGFASIDAGKIWKVAPLKEAAAKISADIPGQNLRDALAELNIAQEAFDGAARILSVRQQDLYGAWWTICRAQKHNKRDADAESQFTKVAAEIVAARQQVHDLETALHRAEEAVGALLESRFELFSEAAPRFWMPSDPVVVIKNMHGAGVPAMPTPLPCRIALPRAHGDTGVDLDSLDASETMITVLQSLVAEALAQEKFTADEMTDKLFGLDTSHSVDVWRECLSHLPTQLPTFVKFWREQPWQPIFMDWQVNWIPSEPPDLWQRNETDFQFSKASPKKSGAAIAIRERSLLTPLSGNLVDHPLNELEKLIDADLEGDLRSFQDWTGLIADLKGGALVGQALTGFHQRFLGRDTSLPAVVPDPSAPWYGDQPTSAFSDASVAELLQQDGDGPRLPRMSPPTASGAVTPSTVRAGRFTIEHLWIVDRFGQWVDVLGGTDFQGTHGVKVNPRSRWPNDQSAMAVPPRLTQAARLGFRFKARGDAASVASSAQPQPISASDPVYGWIFYNALDQALAICDGGGQLLGELVCKDVLVTNPKTKKPGKHITTEWVSMTRERHMSVADIPNDTLRAFVSALISPTPVANPKANDLLRLIADAAQQTTLPSAENPLIGWPLALIGASVQLERFGPALALDAKGTTPTEITVPHPVWLGELRAATDGLIGYIVGSDFERLVHPVGYVGGISSGGYVVGPDSNSVALLPDQEIDLTLLVAPQTSIQMASGLLPTRADQFDAEELRRRMANLEFSFRVGPLLVDSGKGPVKLPTPAGLHGEWIFLESNGALRQVAPMETAPEVNQIPQKLAFGRLILRQPQHATTQSPISIA